MNTIEAKKVYTPVANIESKFTHEVPIMMKKFTHEVVNLRISLHILAKNVKKFTLSKPV